MWKEDVVCLGETKSGKLMQVQLSSNRDTRIESEVDYSEC